jgi:parvulin-like peptidyl-prolyl isomerase
VAVYAAALLYLSADLYVFSGPFARWVGAGRLGADDPVKRGWVARVYGQAVSRVELDAAVINHLARSGASLDDYLPGQSRLALRVHVLENLIEARVLANWADDEPHGAADADVAAALERLIAGSAAPGEGGPAQATDQLSIPVLRSRLRAMSGEQAWADMAIQPACMVSDDDVAAAFAEFGAGLAAPLAVRARHLVLSSAAGRDRSAEIWALHGALSAGQADVASLARRHSDDARTAPGGGDLGYFSLARVPQAVAAQVRDLPAGRLSAPFESAVGWHLVEVVERAAARPLGLREVAPELRARLEALRRREALAHLRSQLRSQPARHVERYYMTLAADAGGATAGPR